VGADQQAVDNFMGLRAPRMRVMELG